MDEIKGFQFKIELDDFKPKIWRRFTVNSCDNLGVFVCDILVLFRTLGYHLAQFKGTDGKEYVFFEDEDWYGDEPPKQIKEFTVGDVFKKIGDSGICEYDFGDGWQFNITLEKIVDRIAASIIEDGEGYGVIEDCGGVYGLKDALKGKKFDLEQLKTHYEKTMLKMQKAYKIR
jgi:hypothetical protein